MTATHEDVIAAARAIDDMALTYTELARLAQPTPPEEVKTRQGPGGRALDYIDARYVMDRLDAVCGAENWQRDHRMTESGKVSCGIGINVSGVGWVWKWDGAGETDIEGEKGSFSDSFKRAAVSWGIARDLYDKDRPAARPALAAPQPLYDARGDEEVREVRPAAVRAAASDGDGRCPAHELPWTLKPGGVSKASGKAYDPFYACPFRPERGESFCKEHPSKPWLARHEVA